MIARTLSIVGALLVILLGLAFHVRNRAPVSLDFYFGTVALPLSWALVAALALGVVLGLLAAWPALLRGRRANRRLARQQAVLRQELAASHPPPPDGR